MSYKRPGPSLSLATMGDTVEFVPYTIPYEKPRAVDPDQKILLCIRF